MLFGVRENKVGCPVKKSYHIYTCVLGDVAEDSLSSGT